MTVNVSGFGTKIRIVASSTYPDGFTVTQFADDSDPLDIPALVVGESSMGLNGDHITWSRANPFEAGLYVIPKSEDDVELMNLFEANRVGKDKRGARDIITLTATYPDGSTSTLSGGVCIVGDLLPGISSSGRYKSKGYRFRFENGVKTGM